VFVGAGTLYAAYVFLRAARRVPRRVTSSGAGRAERSSTQKSVWRVALVCFVFGLVGLLAPIGNVSVGVRVISGIILVLGTLVGAAAVADARNARSANVGKK
jgi:hypothetical protein